MLKLLERDIAAVHERLFVLAPLNASIPQPFRSITASPSRHRELLRELQQLRGSVYLHDGAIAPEQLSADGLHQTPEDEKSWHLVILNAQRRVTGCIWYLEHDQPSLTRLRVHNCPLATSEHWRDALRRAVESDIARARRERIRYAEVGGWAVAPESRRTSEGLMLALGAYSLSQLTGGALVVTTATARHSSSTILRRIGGAQLEADGTTLPAYYDPKYKCEMELLRFDSRRPSAKYAHLIDVLRYSLEKSEVIDSRDEAPFAETPVVEMPAHYNYVPHLREPGFAA
jgi:hypothetical protein